MKLCVINFSGNVGKSTIAVKFGKIIPQALNIVEGVGALWMPRELHFLPRGQSGKYIAA